MADTHQSTTNSQDLTDSNYWNTSWVGKPKRWSLGTRLNEALMSLKGRPFTRLLTAQADKAGSGAINVCELGCAPGGIMAMLHSQRDGLQLNGLDFSSDGLAIAERQFEDQGIPASFHFGDLRKFEPATSYDFVYSCGLIEHFTDPAEIISHHARICRPGGRVLVTVPNYAGYWQERLIAKLDPPILESHNLEVMDESRLAALMSEAGLVDIEVGASGTGKFCTTCTVRNWRTQTLRLAAKGWNIARRVLPLTPGWHCNIWAAGRVPAVAMKKAG